MIPNSWHKVTLENYYPFEKTLSEEPETDLDILDLRIKRACFLSDMEVEDVQNLSMTELHVVDELIQKPMPEKRKIRFKLNGKHYKVLLDPTSWDAWRYKAVMNECRNEKGGNLHRLLFLISIQVKHRFSNKEIKTPPNKVEETMEAFKQLPISLVHPLGVFFWNLSKILMESTLSYSERQMKNLKTRLKQEEASLKNTDG